MPVIDVHNHYYPPVYIEALERGPSTVRITRDAEGNPCLHYPGDYNVAVPGHRDIVYRERVLREAGVDTQVITLTTPGTHVEEPAVAARLAQPGERCVRARGRRQAGRFAALATLAAQRPGRVRDGIPESRRAIEVSRRDALQQCERHGAIRPTILAAL